MITAEMILALRRRGVGRFISLVFEGDPIALTIVGVLVVIGLIIGGIAIYNAAITPDSEVSDEDMSAEERALLDRYNN